MLQVTEVTEPPFLGSTLPPLYIPAQVISQKIGKDTSLERLIKGAKARQLLTPSTH